MERLRDRGEAGRLLARQLARFKQERPVVLALPRGGVPVGYEIAKALDAPLDVLIVRKIGAPDNEELGLGAIVEGPEPRIVWNQDILDSLSTPQISLDEVINRELREIGRRTTAYRSDRLPLSVKGRTVIVADDGVATGGTARAALRGIRQSGAARTILAVGVAPADTLSMLAPECDGIVCLIVPAPFYAVGAHYDRFDQTSDAEVVALLNAARDFGSSPGADIDL
jgi:putative phosphoribosyl transferase